MSRRGLADDGGTASRLGALLASIQQIELLAESVAERVAGEHGGWAVVTALEAWKALCRLRLLRQQPAARLLYSLAPEEPESGDDEAWESVLARINGGSRLRERACSPHARPRHAQLSNGGGGGGGGGGAGPSSVAAPAAEVAEGALWPSPGTLIRAGELLHVLQPVVYLLLLLLRVGRLAPASRPRLAALCRRAPWLAALALELAALSLCTRGVALARRTTAAERDTQQAELRHRRSLVLLFVLRPAARAATRRLIVRLAGRAHGRPYLASWCTLALELIDSLQTSCAFRYFRASETGLLQ